MLTCMTSQCVTVNHLKCLVMCFELCGTFVCDLIESHRRELWDFLELLEVVLYIITVILLVFICNNFIAHYPVSALRKTLLP